MIALRWVSRVFVVLLAASCASAPQAPVEVVGPGADLSAMEGEWLGEYESAETGRAGTILFALVAEEAIARGEVWMIPAERGPRLPYESGPPAPLELLTIRFVLIENGRVRGVLDPYPDPETGCTLRTSFLGWLEGDGISGTFVTANEVTGATVTGAWRAERKRTAAPEGRR